MDWRNVHFFWGDERCVPPDHAESNFGMTKELLFDHIDIPEENIHRIKGEAFPEQEAERYSREIEQNLRIDTDAMNRDLADAVNASVDKPKAFLTYTLISTLSQSSGNGGSSWNQGGGDSSSRIVLCCSGVGEPANNLEVLVREAKSVLSTHFRNVQVCKCGA